MGTRSLICIYYKGRFMVAQYTQWDGYLEGQGWGILQFLLVPGNIERLKAGMEFITIVDQDTVQQLAEGHEYNTYDRVGQRVCQCGAIAPISGPSPCVPSSLSRDTGSKLFDLIASARSDSYMPFLLSLDFATDGLFCEYCYCVDLDADTFELFGGHTRNVKSEDGQHTGKYRFSAVDPDAEWTPNFLKSFSFSDLPKDLDDMLAKITADNPSNVEYEVDDEKDSEEDDEHAAKDDDNDDADGNDEKDNGNDEKEEKKHDNDAEPEAEK